MDLGRGAAHHPGDADRGVVAVADQQVVGQSNVRSTSSSVTIVSPGSARRTRKARPGQAVEVVGVVGLAQLEHDVVRHVDHVVDRAHARPAPAARPSMARTAAPPRRSSTVAVKRPHRSGARMSTGVGDGADRPADHGRMRIGEGHAQVGGQVAGHAAVAPGVGPVAGEVEVEHDVGESTPRASVHRDPERQAGRQDQDAAVVVAHAQLARRAEHAVRPLAPQLAAGDLQAVGHHGAERGQRHEVADGHVEGAAADLQRLAVAGVDVDELDAVGRRVGAQGQHLGHDDAVDRLADDDRLLDRQAEGARACRPARQAAPSMGASSRSQDSSTFIRTAPGSGCRW